MTTQPGDSRWNALSRITLNGSLGASVVALLIGALVVLSGLTAVVAAAFAPGVGKVKPEEELNALIAKHNEQLKTWQDRLNGRSPFFKPQAPPPPPPKVVEKPELPIIIEPPKPPGPPPSYPGPPVAFVVDDTVYFHPMTAGENMKFARVRVGEEQHGIRVISVSLPWTVRVGMKGGEYDVPVFNRSDQTAFVKGASHPVILQDSFISAVSPAPAVMAPPPSSPAPEPAVTQAAVVAGEEPPQPHRRGQPARAVPQPPDSQRQPPGNPRQPRGAPPENAPPQPADEEPIEESGVDEPQEEPDEGLVEDPEAEQEAAEEAPPASPPQTPSPQAGTNGHGPGPAVPK